MIWVLKIMRKKNTAKRRNTETLRRKNKRTEGVALTE